MSEQKYYVRLKRFVYIKEKAGYIYHGVIWLDNNWNFVNGDSRQSFTKSELAKIMDGALYRGHEKNIYCVLLGCEEWINPLIELVPVEEE